MRLSLIIAEQEFCEAKWVQQLHEKKEKDGQVMKENDNILLTEEPGNLMKKYSVHIRNEQQP